MADGSVRLALLPSFAMPRSGIYRQSIPVGLRLHANTGQVGFVAISKHFLVVEQVVDGSTRYAAHRVEAPAHLPVPH